MAKAGRPPLTPDDATERVTVRVPSMLRAAVTAEAERWELTASDAMRQALALWLVTDPARRAQTAEAA
jgi:hypothetical protein